MSTRCVLYLRVSTDKQARGFAGKYASDVEGERFSLPSQVESCEKYAAEQGWTVVDRYVEADSGYELWERPELTKLRVAMEKKEFDVVLVHALDRLSRDQNHRGLLFAEAERYGISIRSVTEEVDDSPLGKLILSLSGYVAEMERAKLIERTVRGRRTRSYSDMLPIRAQRLFGYEFDGDRKERFIINENEALWVRRVFEEMVAGTSLYKIAEMLNEHGVTTVNGKKWTASRIREIIMNEIYKGEVYSFRYKRYDENENGKRIRLNSAQLRQREEWIKSKYVPPLIISPRLWEEANVKLRDPNKMRTWQQGRKYEDELLLKNAGQAVCGICGSQLQRVRSKKRNKPLKNGQPSDKFYFWDNYRHNPSQAKNHDCRVFSIGGETVDNFVWECVIRILKDDEWWNQLKQSANESDPTERDRLLVSSQIDQLQKEHDEIAEGLKRAALYLPEQTLAAMGKELQEKLDMIEKLKQEQVVLDRKYEDWLATRVDYDQLDAFRQAMAEKVRKNTPLERRRIYMDALRIRVEMFPSNHEVRAKVYATINPNEVSQLIGSMGGTETATSSKTVQTSYATGSSPVRSLYLFLGALHGSTARFNTELVAA